MTRPRPRDRTTPRATDRFRWIRLDAHRVLPVRPVSIANLERDRTAERVSSADARENVGLIVLDRHPPASAVAELATGEVGGEIGRSEREAGGNAFDDHDERRAVRFASCQKSQHLRGHSIELSAIARTCVERNAHASAASFLHKHDATEEACGCLRYELIGDRFHSSGSSRWIDLATGQPAEVLVRSFEHEWPAIERHLEAQLRCSGDARLVDYGRINTSRWFEARAPAGRSRSHGLCIADSFIDDIALTAESTNVGIRHRRVELPVSETLSTISALARRLRASGLVTVRACVHLPEVLRLALAHRHVAIVSCHGDDSAMTVRWIRKLVSVSPRGHAVIAFEPANAFHARASGREQVAEWLAHVQRAIAVVNALFARSRARAHRSGSWSD